MAEVAGAETARSKVEKIHALQERFPGQDVYWYVGDTAGDVREAREAGATPVGVAWGWHEPEMLLEAGAERVAAPAELLSGAELGRHGPVLGGRANAARARRSLPRLAGRRSRGPTGATRRRAATSPMPPVRLPSRCALTVLRWPLSGRGAEPRPCRPARSGSSSSAKAAHGRRPPGCRAGRRRAAAGAASPREAYTSPRARPATDGNRRPRCRRRPAALLASVSHRPLPPGSGRRQGQAHLEPDRAAAGGAGPCRGRAAAMAAAQVAPVAGRQRRRSGWNESRSRGARCVVGGRGGDARRPAPGLSGPARSPLLSPRRP